MTIQGVYPAADVCAIGSEISSTYEGRHVTLFPDNISHGSQVTVVTKGYGVWFEDAVGMPFVTQTAETNLIKQGVMDTEGIWCVDVKGETDVDLGVAVAVGDRLYINTTTGLVSKVSAAATQLPFGYALGIVGSGLTERIAVKVHFDPVVAAALEVRGTPGDGNVFASVGNSTYPLVYAAASDKALEVWAKFTLATTGAFYGIESDVAYEPIGNSGYASPLGVVGRVTLKAGVTFTGGQAGMEGVRGHLVFEHGADVDQANAILTAMRGVITVSGTPIYTAFEGLCGLFIDIQGSINMSGIAGLFKSSGILLQNQDSAYMDAAIRVLGGAWDNLINFDRASRGGNEGIIHTGGGYEGSYLEASVLVDGVEHRIRLYKAS